jgi:predicted transcriptional regulator
MSSNEVVTSDIEGVEKEKDLPVTVTVSYGSVKAEFSGSPETVLQSISSFLSKQIPALSLARKITVNFSAKDLVDKFQDCIRITPEGARVWEVSERKYSDKEIVALQLTAQRIEAEATSNKAGTAMSLTALQETTGLNPKSLSSRLSELSKSGFVTRESSGEGTTFRITTQGVDWLANTLSRKQK